MRTSAEKMNLVKSYFDNATDKTKLEVMADSEKRSVSKQVEYLVTTHPEYKNFKPIKE